MEIRGKKGSAFINFWRRHPYLRSVVTTIAVFAVIATITALIQWISNTPVPPPPIPGPPTPQPTTVTMVVVTTAPSPQPDPKLYGPGTCLAGDFNSSDPDAVKTASCSSDGAREVLDVFPGERDPSICRNVTRARLGYVEIQEEVRDGVTTVISTTVYCLS